MIRGAALAATLVLCLLAAAAGTEAQPRDRVRLIAKEEIEGVVAARARRAGGGLIVMPDGFNLTHRDLIIALAARYGVPAIYFNVTYFSQSGGLISYGPDFTEYFRQAAGYIHRIFNAIRLDAGRPALSGDSISAASNVAVDGRRSRPR